MFTAEPQELGFNLDLKSTLTLILGSMKAGMSMNSIRNVLRSRGMPDDYAELRQALIELHGAGEIQRISVHNDSGGNPFYVYFSRTYSSWYPGCSPKAKAAAAFGPLNPAMPDVQTVEVIKEIEKVVEVVREVPVAAGALPATPAHITPDMVIEDWDLPNSLSKVVKSIYDDRDLESAQKYLDKYVANMSHS